MGIEYIAMYVNNLEKTKDFLLNILMRYQMKGTIIRKQIFALIF